MQGVRCVGGGLETLSALEGSTILSHHARHFRTEGLALQRQKPAALFVRGCERARPAEAGPVSGNHLPSSTEELYIIQVSEVVVSEQRPHLRTPRNLRSSTTRSGARPCRTRQLHPEARC